MLSLWGRLGTSPAGRWLYSRLVGWYIPYTGSIGCVIERLEPGHAIVRLPYRRKIRNHLNSVHAIALANLAEFSTGLAVLSGMPSGQNGILVGIDVSYEKKARGVITAECRTELPDYSSSNAERIEVPVETVIRDGAGEVTTRAVARWLIGPLT